MLEYPIHVWLYLCLLRFIRVFLIYSTLYKYKQNKDIQTYMNSTHYFWYSFTIPHSCIPIAGSTLWIYVFIGYPIPHLLPVNPYLLNFYLALLGIFFLSGLLSAINVFTGCICYLISGKYLHLWIYSKCRSIYPYWDCFLALCFLSLFVTITTYLSLWEYQLLYIL